MTTDSLPDDYLEAVERRCRRFQGTWDQGTSGSLAADAFRLLRERKKLMSTIAELEQANASLRAAVEERIAAAEAACCEGEPLCTAIDTQGPMVDPERVIADDDEHLDGRCVVAYDPAAMEAAWNAVKARHQALHEAIRTEPEVEPVYAERRPRVFGSDGPVAAEEAMPTPAEKLLRTAIDVIRDRRTTYGPPTDHFKITVGLLNAAFTDKLRRRLEAGEPPFTVDDWPVVMLLDKVARDAGPRTSTDTPIDLAGYAATLAECRQA